MSFKNGDKVYAAGHYGVLRYIGIIADGSHAIENVKGEIHRSNSVSIVSSPSVSPYSYSTFPFNAVAWVREKGAAEVDLVYGGTQHTVVCGSYAIPYSKLATDYEISLDGCDTWKACGIINEVDK